MQLITNNEFNKTRFSDWRKSGTPEFAFQPLHPDLSKVPDEHKRVVNTLCLQEYKKSREVQDQAIGDAALAYVHKNGNAASIQPGPLLLLARDFSRRILDLYVLYCRYEMEHNIPMLPVDAGQLKNDGCVSEEILRMQEGCKKWLAIVSELKDNLPKEQYEEFFKILTSPAERKRFAAENPTPSPKLSAIQHYEAIEEKNLIDHACFMMSKFRDSSLQDIELQLQAVALMTPNPHASLDQRILMEIRHRVAGEGNRMNCPGSLGSNPLAYLNLIRQGDDESLKGEFRGLLYFTYMNNHFMNACMQDPFIAFANQRLSQEKRGWMIDPEFVAAMKTRSPNSCLPPIFRYGSNAAINSLVREHHHNATFYEKHHPPFLKDVMEGTCSYDDSFRYPLSKRELMNQIGDFRQAQVPPHRTIQMTSGGAAFRIKSIQEMDNSPQGEAAKQYLVMCQELQLPMIASISGTFDQMAAMGGFLGLTLEPCQLEILKVAMIAFMVPNRDHSVDEILQSSKSYNLEYIPGPGFERFIFPSMGEVFLKQIHAEMQKRKAKLPSYYLTAEHAQQCYQKQVAP